MIRILIVHKPGLTRDLLVKAFSHEPDVEIMLPVDTARAALAALAEQACDVMLVDYQLPDAQATTLLQVAGREFPRLRMVVMGLPDIPTKILACLELGAAGYVCQADTMQDLVQKVYGVMQGEAVLSPRVAGALIVRLQQLVRVAMETNGYVTGHEVARVVALSPREREIMQLLSQGYRNQEIAETLQIATKTVERHVHNILETLDVHSREQAVMVVRQLTWAEAQVTRQVVPQPALSLPVTRSFVDKRIEVAK